MSAGEARPSIAAARDGDPRSRARRPLFAIAIAVAAGSWAGASGACTAELGRALALASISAWIASAFALRGLASRAALERWLERCALASVLGLAIARGASHETAAEPRETDAALASRLPLGGTWRSVSRFADVERGELQGSPSRYEVPRGSIATGERVRILSRSEPVRCARGPVDGPRAKYSNRTGPIDVASDEIVRESAAPSSWSARAARALEAAREALLARTESLADPTTRALLAAFLLGDASGLETETSDLFVRTGTYHVVAISGLQVALVALIVIWPASACAVRALAIASRGRWRCSPAWLRVPALAAFVPLVGGGAPVVRSALAFAIGSLASEIAVARPFARVESTGDELCMRRRTDGIALWSLALVVECAARPDAAATLSLQLSYAATLGLIAGTGPMIALLREVLGSARVDRVDALGRVRSDLWRVPLQRSIDVLLAACAASMVAVLATLPWTWARFGEWSPAGIVATPLIVAPMAVMLALGWVWFFVPWAPVERVLDWAAHATLTLLEGCDALPCSPCPLPPRPWWWIAVASIATFAALRARARRLDANFDARSDAGASSSAAAWIDSTAAPRWTAAAARSKAIGPSRAWRLAALAWGIACLPWTAAPRALELWALDVGGGTAVAFRAPGLGAWIFDAGSRDRPEVGREAVAPLLRAWDVDEIGVALSHEDQDHDGALTYLCDRFPPHTWLGALPARCRVRLPHRTAVLDLPRGASTVEFPSADPTGAFLVLERGSSAPGNEGSRSVTVRWGEERVLLCGDAEEEGLAAGLADRATPLPHRMVLLPHHGSDTPWLGVALAKLRPDEVWISTSGVPPVARELDRRGQRFRCTARDGPLELVLAPADGVPAARGE